jgi:hypothetical protein
MTHGPTLVTTTDEYRFAQARRLQRVYRAVPVPQDPAKARRWQRTLREATFETSEALLRRLQWDARLATAVAKVVREMDPTAVDADGQIVPEPQDFAAE